MGSQPSANHRTYAGSTETTEGVIHHIRVTWGGGTLLAPVRVQSGAMGTGEMKGLRRPERDERGRLVYALPGGGKYVP